MLHLFVNANHEEVQRTLPQILKDRKVIFIGNGDANVEGLKFPVERHFKVGNNAWLHDYEIIQELKDYISNFAGLKLVFLFACGPLSNYLITEIWKETSRPLSSLILVLPLMWIYTDTPQGDFMEAKVVMGNFVSGTTQNESINTC